MGRDVLAGTRNRLSELHSIARLIAIRPPARTSPVPPRNLRWAAPTPTDTEHRQPQRYAANSTTMSCSRSPFAHPAERVQGHRMPLTDSTPENRPRHSTSIFPKCGELAPQLLINGSTTTQRVRGRVREGFSQRVREIFPKCGLRFIFPNSL